MSSPAQRSVWSQVKSGLRLTAAILVAIAWLFLVYGGAAVAFSKTHYPRALGWAILAATGAVFVLTAQRWVKALPGLLAYGVLNGLFATVNGHLGVDASRTIPRGAAAATTLLLAGCALFAIPLASRKPTAIDRVAILGVFVSFVLGIFGCEPPLLSGAGMCLFLACAWANGRFRQRRNRGTGGNRRQ
jgi:hypothetical protein